MLHHLLFKSWKVYNLQYWKEIHFNPNWKLNSSLGPILFLHSFTPYLFETIHLPYKSFQRCVVLLKTRYFVKKWVHILFIRSLESDEAFFVLNFWLDDLGSPYTVSPQRYQSGVPLNNRRVQILRIIWVSFSLSKGMIHRSGVGI